MIAFTLKIFVISILITPLCSLAEDGQVRVWLNKNNIDENRIVILKDQGFRIKQDMKINEIIFRKGSTFYIAFNEIDMVDTANTVDFGPFSAKGLIKFFEGKPIEFTISKDVTIYDAKIPKGSVVRLSPLSGTAFEVQLGKKTTISGVTIEGGHFVHCPDGAKQWKLGRYLSRQD